LNTAGGGLDEAVIDVSGFLKGARFVPSPNFDERPPDIPISLLVVHAISLPPQRFGGNEVVEFFTNRLDAAAHPFFETLRDLRVSAHFFIRRDGAVIQFVSCNLRAWHAGQSEWKGRPRCNDFSIGIELEGSDHVPFEDAQYAALARLANAIRRAYPIADVVGHADIAPGRKTDPGPCFDWPRFRAMLD
jgi:AmpD protein